MIKGAAEPKGRSGPRYASAISPTTEEVVFRD